MRPLRSELATNSLGKRKGCARLHFAYKTRTACTEFSSRRKFKVSPEVSPFLFKTGKALSTRSGDGLRPFGTLRYENQKG